MIGSGYTNAAQTTARCLPDSRAGAIDLSADIITIYYRINCNILNIAHADTTTNGHRSRHRSVASISRGSPGTVVEYRNRSVTCYAGDCIVSIVFTSDVPDAFCTTMHACTEIPFCSRFGSTIRRTGVRRNAYCND